MRKLMLIIAVVMLAADVSGCYMGGVAGLAGYDDTRLSEDMYLVSFSGNAFTSEGKVQKYLMRRCAEVTVEAGYDSFVILDGDSSTREYMNASSGGTYTSHTSMQGTTTGNTTRGTATTTGTYNGGNAYTYTKTEKSATIRMFEGVPDGAIDAKMMLGS